MKKLVILSLLMVLTLVVQGQAVVKGIVYKSPTCDERGLQPVTNAEISAIGANKAYSNNNGSFTLNFPAKKPGQEVAVTVIKEGLVQITKSITIGNDPDRAVPLIMCTRRDYNAVKNAPRQIAEASRNTILANDRLARIEEMLTKSPKDSEEYKELLKEKEEIQKALRANEEELGRVSAQLSDKNWKIVSTELQKMLSKEATGNKEKKDQVFSEELVNVFCEVFWDSYMRETLDSLGQAGDRNLQKEITENRCKALFFSIDLQFEKAEPYYRRLTELENNNIEALIDYAQNLNILNKTNEAIAQLEKALKIEGEDDILYVRIATFLAGLYLQSDQTDKTESMLRKGLGRYNSIAEDTSNYIDKQEIRAVIHENYGALYYKKKQFDNAIKEYQEAEKIYNNLSTRNGGYLNDLASINSKLGSLYSDIKKYNEALALFNKSLSIYNELAKEGDELYILAQCEVGFEIADLYYIRNDFTTAGELYKQIGDRFRSMASKYPERFQEYIAKVYYAEGNMKLKQKDYFMAESKFGESLNIYTRLNTGQSSRYDPYISSTLNAKGQSLFSQNQYKKAKEQYDEALSINLNLVKKAQEIYEPNLAESYSLLGRYFLSTDQPDSAYYYYMEALRISEKYDKKDPRVYKLSLIQNKQNLATYYFKQGENGKAKEEMAEAHKMAQDLVALDSTVFLPDYAETVLGHGLVYLDEEENEVAVKKFKEALAIFQKLSKEQPDVYELPKATILWGLGLCSIVNGDDRQAVDYLDQAVRICEKQLGKNTNAYAPVLARVYLSKAKLSENKEDFPGALRHYKEAESLYSDLHSNTTLDEYQNAIGDIKIRMAQIHIRTENYQQAENTTNEARRIFGNLIMANSADKKAYQAKLATIERGSARLNLGRGHYHDALRDFRSAEAYYRQLRNELPPTYHVEECNVKLDIGETQRLLGQDQSAMQMFKSVIDTVADALRLKPGYEQHYLPTLAKVHAEIGSMNFSDAPEEALKNFDKAVEEYQRIQDKSEDAYDYEIAVIYLNKGIIYSNAQQFKEAIYNLQQALRHIENLPNLKSNNYYHIYIGANRMLGNIYYHVQDYDNAKQHLLKCLDAGEKLGDFLTPVEILILKMNAGISCIKASEGNDEAKGQATLKEAKVYAIQQHWPAEESQRVNDIIKEICRYIDCRN